MADASTLPSGLYATRRPNWMLRFGGVGWATTGSATMSRECDDEVDGSSRACIAEVVECACADAVSFGVLGTLGTGAGSEVA